MPSLVATTSTPARKPFVRTHYGRTNFKLQFQNACGLRHPCKWILYSWRKPENSELLGQDKQVDFGQQNVTQWKKE